MDENKTNYFKTNQYKTINEKFEVIESHFIFKLDNSIKIERKNHSHPNFKKWSIIKKQNQNNQNKIAIDKTNQGNQLDQIGNDDLIFNNDKLITSIKLEKLNEFIPIDENDNLNKKDENKDMSGSLIRAKIKKFSLSPISGGRSKRFQKINSPKSHKRTNNNKIYNDGSLIKLNKTSKGKISNLKSPRNNKNFFQQNRNKIINQFINKPNDSNINYTKKYILMTPMPKKNLSKMSYTNSFKDIRFSKAIENQNETISLVSAIKVGGHRTGRVKSMPSHSNLKSNIHFPNKSIIKSKDKFLNELQKIFGDRMQLNDELYQNMTNEDKKNCINFLLESIKELYNINKVIQAKSDEYKEIIEKKEKQLKEVKNEIKELKKESNKLNKIIKANIQMNRKLSLNIDNLKLQLEKEKNKNKELQSRGNPLNKAVLNSSNLKFKNETNELSLTTTKKNRLNMSQDRFRNTNDFINIKKNIDNNKRKIKNNKSKENNNNNLNNNDNNIKEDNNNKIKVLNSLSNIKIEKNKNNSNVIKEITNDSQEIKNSVNNLNNNINFDENINEKKNNIEKI